MVSSMIHRVSFLNSLRPDSVILFRQKKRKSAIAMLCNKKAFTNFVVDTNTKMDAYLTDKIHL